MKVCLAGNIPPKTAQEFWVDSKYKPYCLQSFIDYHKGNEEHFLNLKNNSGHFMLDSGAFSMIYGKSIDNLPEYIDKYIAFINKHDIKYYIELDLYDVIGKAKTLKIRRKIEAKTGRQSIPVFHKSLGMDFYKGLVTDYNYIGIGGVAKSGRNGYNVSIFSMFIKEAKKQGCKVHGLGFTSTRSLPLLGFFSVDSTSWLSPLRYGGSVHRFDGKGIEVIKKPEGKRIVVDAVRRHQMKEWIKYQKYANKL